MNNMNNNQPNRNYKVCIMGDGGVGKTTWMKRILTNKVEPRYVATMGVEVHPVHLVTNRGTFVLNMWDIAGQDKYGGLREGYCSNGDAFIFVHRGDYSSSLAQRKRDCACYSNGRPQITICNTEQPLIEGDVDLLRGNNPYEPLLRILRELLGDPQIRLLL